MAKSATSTATPSSARWVRFTDKGFAAGYPETEKLSEVLLRLTVLSVSIKPSDDAFFVLIKNMSAEKVLKEIKDAGGVVLKTTLDETKEKVLRDAWAQTVATDTSAKLRWSNRIV
jgi:Protein of unknown function (DUF1269)